MEEMIIDILCNNYAHVHSHVQTHVRTHVRTHGCTYVHVAIETLIDIVACCAYRYPCLLMDAEARTRMCAHAHT